MSIYTSLIDKFRIQSSRDDEKTTHSRGSKGDKRRRRRAARRILAVIYICAKFNEHLTTNVCDLEIYVINYQLIADAAS